MRGALRIALAYFSGAPLLSWISLCGCVMAGGGLLLASSSSSPSFASNVMDFAKFGAFVLILGPLYQGGVWMREASTPSIMHLRPHGRRQMLFGAVLAITISSLALTLPSAACSFTPAGTVVTGSVPFFTVGRNLCGDFGLPAGAQIQLVWGTVALIWIALFTLSSQPVLLAFIWAPLVAVFLLWERLAPEVPYTREQLATVVFAAGVAAWSAFSLWYFNAPHVLRRRLRAARLAGQTPEAFPRLDMERWFRRSAARDSRVSRTRAVSRYLTDTDAPIWRSMVTGVFLAVLFLAMNALRTQPPLTLTLMAVAAFSATLAALSVRRARLLWLRAGLDRASLFATTERLALRALGLLVAIPFAAMAALAVARHPALAVPVLLHVGTLLVFAIGALFAGMMATRGTLAAFGLFIVAGVPSVLLLAALQPEKVTSPWTHIGALLLFSALAFLLRGLAKRAWCRLDWRVTGPPIVQSPG